MDENKKLVLAALVVLFGSNAGSVVNAVNPNTRADPFTGTEGKELRRLILDNTAEDKRWRESHLDWGNTLARVNSQREGKQEEQLRILMQHHHQHHGGVQ